MFEPLEREPETKEFYDNERSRSISRKIAIQVVDQIKLYQKNGYQVCGVFGVEGSPTCGAIKTHIKNNDGKVTSIFGSGIFFEELKNILAEQGISVDLYDWDIQAKKAISK
jgi:predicted secreted protein